MYIIIYSIIYIVEIDLKFSSCVKTKEADSDDDFVW